MLGHVFTWVLGFYHQFRFGSTTNHLNYPCLTCNAPLKSYLNSRPCLMGKRERGRRTKVGMQGGAIRSRGPASFAKICHLLSLPSHSLSATLEGTAPRLHCLSPSPSLLSTAEVICRIRRRSECKCIVFLQSNMYESVGKKMPLFLFKNR